MRDRRSYSQIGQHVETVCTLTSGQQGSSWCNASRQGNNLYCMPSHTHTHTHTQVIVGSQSNIQRTTAYRRGLACAGLCSMAWYREGQAARSQCLPCCPRLPKAARKARPASASLHGKSAGQHTPPPAVLLPATLDYSHAHCAARYNTWLLMRLMPNGIVSSSLCSFSQSSPLV